MWNTCIFKDAKSHISIDHIPLDIPEAQVWLAIGLHKVIDYFNKLVNELINKQRGLHTCYLVFQSRNFYLYLTLPNTVPRTFTCPFYFIRKENNHYKNKTLCQIYAYLFSAIRSSSRIKRTLDTRNYYFWWFCVLF